MSDFTRYTSMHSTCPHTYFAGANTADGFVCRYSAHLDEKELDCLYILKGGSGTGKSTLIRACGERAAEIGADVTLLLCSSDPSSADAVILHAQNGRRIAVLDGTAPHTTDPLLPGAVGQICNAGSFWDRDILRSRREEIALRCTSKASSYARAYHFLAAYRRITLVQKQLVGECIRFDKMIAAAARIAATLPAEKTPTESCVYTGALSMTGAYHLTTFTDLAKKEYRITDHYGSGEFFLAALHEQLRLRKVSVSYAPSVPCPDMYSEMYLPAVSAAITVGEERGEGHITNINMLRFIDKDALSLRRARIRFAEKCRGEMLDGALQALGDAASAHFALEEIYKSAMDFDALAAERWRICEEIAERLGE